MTNKELLDYVKEKISPHGELIFLTITGSYLYGTNTETSDKDYVGVFVGNLKAKLGFNKINEIDCSYVSKDENGKNKDDAIDIKVYELEKFLKLAGDVNPNIIELIFATSDNHVLYNTDIFKLFQDNYEIFLNRRIFQSFQGYAIQQFKKGVTKAQNYNKLKEIIKILEKYDGKEFLAVVVENEKELKKFDKGFHIEVNGLSFQKNIFVKKIKKQMEEKLKLASHRMEMWEKYGYDTKFFMHLFRLLDEGTELILNKKLEFPVKNVEFLLNVRNGKYKLNVIQEMAEKRFEEFKKLPVENLPKKAKWNIIEKMMLDVYKKFFEKHDCDK